MPRCGPYCQQFFEPSQCHPHQLVCGRPECQRRRPADYRRAKLRATPPMPKGAAQARASGANSTLAIGMNTVRLTLPPWRATASSSRRGTLSYIS
jgi:hypothetical protein